MFSSLRSAKLEGMTTFIKVIAAVTFLGIAILCFQVISTSVANQHLKSDYAEINHIKYGLFSVDEWKKQLEIVVSDEIGDFELGRSNEKEIKAQIQIQLGVLIDRVADRIRQSNQGSFKGRLKQAFINSFVDINQIKAGIPSYADAMMNELKKAKNERKLKHVVKREVAKYFDQSFDVNDRTRLQDVLTRAGTDDVSQAKDVINARVAAKQRLITQQSWLMIALAVFLFALIGFKREPLSAFEYVALLGSLISLLAVGVATPMIDMEAQISLMRFVLLDHEIVFKNQILYFQSKGILDVFWLMIRDPEIAMKCVGVLVVTFSVIFPVSKLISTGLFYFDALGARRNRIVHFFVMKSGKWSMSDVLVVAIFMSYIGFNGILSSQLGKLKELAGDIQLLTTNGTTLQPGFYLFLSYVLLSLGLSLMLEHATKDSATVKAATIKENSFDDRLVAAH